MILAAALVLVGKGFLTDGSHPKHPGDFRKHEAKLRVELDAEAGLASIAIETGEGDAQDIDRYFVRRGRTFQLDAEGKEIPARDLGDLSVPAIAALHPALVESALSERSEHVRDLSGGASALAWNDVLWTVARKAGAVSGMQRRTFDDVRGDGSETIAYERAPDRVVVRRGRETASFVFERAEPVEAIVVPEGDDRRDRGHVVRRQEIDFRELAPRLFAIDLPSTNSRVFVAEFDAHLAVLEGAYSARNGDLLARAIRERFGKPVRYHAFSHLHGQYVGSTRSFVAEGATILVPPTTVALIEEIARPSRSALHPDAQSRVRTPLKVEAVERARRLEDATNVLEVHNVPSEHTDEYFVFWFPGPKVLLTGDLLFYRPGQPLAGRSKRLCRTVGDLRLAPERLVATWPLEGYGTESVVAGEAFSAACAEAP